MMKIVKNAYFIPLNFHSHNIAIGSHKAYRLQVCFCFASKFEEWPVIQGNYAADFNFLKTLYPMQVNPLATLKVFCTTGTVSASQCGLCSIV